MREPDQSDPTDPTDPAEPGWRDRVVDLLSAEPDLAGELERIIEQAETASTLGTLPTGELDVHASHRSQAIHVPGELPAHAPVQVPGHELRKCLGAGGFGQVWLAYKPSTDHYRAVKLIPAHKLLELEGVRRLKQRVPTHPGLFPIEDDGEADGWLYLLMPLADNAASDAKEDFVRGYRAMTLEALLRRGRRPAPDEVASIGAELAAGLQHLHDHDVTHGDIKPGNIFRLGERWTLADYGLARDLESPTGGGHSPEYAQKDEPLGTPRADQYALGVVLMELLTGLTPSMAADFRAMPASRLKLSDAGRRVRGVILRAIAESPADRYESPAALAAALRRAVRRPVPVGWIGVGAAAGLALLVGGALMLRPPATDVGTTAEPLQVRAMHVDHYRYDAASNRDEILGRIGEQSFAARFDDAVTIDLTLSRPGHAYLLALDTTGEVTLCHPASPNEPPERSARVVFPADPGAYYVLGVADGLQGFVVVLSDEPLPAFAEWSVAQGLPAWSAAESGVHETWLIDRASVRPVAPTRPEDGTRGEVRTRRGAPEPVMDVHRWVRDLEDRLDARGLVFPVMPKP